MTRAPGLASVKGDAPEAMTPRFRAAIGAEPVAEGEVSATSTAGDDRRCRRPPNSPDCPAHRHAAGRSRGRHCSPGAVSSEAVLGARTNDEQATFRSASASADRRSRAARARAVPGWKLRRPLSARGPRCARRGPAVRARVWGVNAPRVVLPFGQITSEGIVAIVSSPRE